MKKKKEKKKIKVSKPKKDINDLIDDLAYSNENIQKSKLFLDNMYLLKQE